MKITIKKTKIEIYVLVAVFLILFILDYRCFYLFTYPSWMKIFTDNSLDIIAGVVGIVLSLYCFQKYSRFDQKTYRKLFKYYWICAILWIVIVIYSTIIYPAQPFSKTIGAHASLMYIGFAIPCLSLFYMQKGIDGLFKLINIIVFVWQILLVYQFFVWAYSGTFIFDFESIFSQQIRIRNYGLRIPLKSLGHLALLYNFDCFVNRRKKGISKYFSIIQIILGIFCLIFVQQTRAFILIDFLAIAVIAICGAKRMTKKFVIFTVFIAVIGYFISNHILTEFFNSFMISASNNQSLGTSIRLDAIKYYLQRFFDTCFLGNGFSSDLYYPAVHHGASGDFFYNDVGIFGLIGEIGLAAVVFYGLPLWYATKTLIIVLRKGLRYEYTLYISIVVYMIGTSFTLILTDQERATAFPIVIAVIEYTHRQIKQKKASAS